jgi:hypothetical protein
LTRHELKDQLQHDHFTDAVSGAVTYASSHRQNLIRYGVAAVVAVVLASGFWWYSSSQTDQRRQELDSAMSILDAQVGPAAAADSTVKTYPTDDAKKEAWTKSLTAYISKYGGTSEGYIAQYYRGTERAQKDDQPGAESDLKVVADSNSNIAPLAKIALANLYLGQKKNVEAQTLLQGLTKDSSPLVSKAQAVLLQAQLNQNTNPQAAKDVLKGLDPADEKREAVKRAAEQINADMAK